MVRSIRKQFELNARKPYFYASAVALICCLLISAIGINKNCENERLRAETYEKDVKKAEKEVQKIKQVAGELDSWIGQYDESAQFLNDRNKYTAMLNDLQQLMPDRMWLVSMETSVAAEGGEEEYAEEGAVKKEKTKHQTVKSVNALREVTKLALSGYTLNIYRDVSEFNKFRNNLKKSKFFEEKLRVARLDNASNSNLTYFEIELTLKEPIKK